MPLVDIEHLGHKFKLIYEDWICYSYLCEKCNCVVDLYINNHAKYDNLLLMYDNDKYYEKLNLTCDEIIIKNIIE